MQHPYSQQQQEQEQRDHQSYYQQQYDAAAASANNDGGYLYPPTTNNGGNSHGNIANAYELSREQSLGGETIGGNSMMHSPYDEKLAAAAGTSSDGLPAAIPRYPNGRPAPAEHGSKSSVSFVPGHLSRGSVALLAAAEGNMPKKEALRIWRKDEHAGVFTAGGRRRTCMRCCCCTIIFALILVIGVVAAFLLWVSGRRLQSAVTSFPRDTADGLHAIPV